MSLTLISDCLEKFSHRSLRHPCSSSPQSLSFTLFPPCFHPVSTLFPPCLHTVLYLGHQCLLFRSQPEIDGFQSKYLFPLRLQRPKFMNQQGILLRLLDDISLAVCNQRCTAQHQVVTTESVDMVASSQQSESVWILQNVSPN